MPFTIKYTPYFYIIQHLNSGKYYAGSKWGKSSYKHKQRFANPAYFMIENGYLTSSNIVKNIIKSDGLSSLIVRKIKTFSTAEEARNYEYRFLRKVNAKTNEKFLNMHENTLIAWGTEEYRQASLKKYGVDHPSQSENVKQKIKKSTKLKCGVEYGFLLDKSKETMLEKYGVKYTLQSKKLLEIRKCNHLQKYGVDHPMKRKEISQKMLKTKLEKYGSKISPAEAQATINRNKNRAKRKNVLSVLELKNNFKLKLGRNWWMKSDAEVDSLLLKLQQEYTPQIHAKSV